MLLDDVLIAFFLRSRDVIRATEASRGRVECPRCANVIQRNEAQCAANDLTELICCDRCGWEVTWGIYLKSFQHKQLFWGGAFPAVKIFVEGFDAARTPRDKMLLIDRFIHAFHWQMTQYPGRPAATMVIEGKEKEVVALIETLAFADNCPPEMQANREEWKRRHQPRVPPTDALPWKEDVRGLVAQYAQEGAELARRLQEKEGDKTSTQGTSTVTSDPAQEDAAP